jgi:hypothetical protein
MRVGMVTRDRLWVSVLFDPFQEKSGMSRLRQPFSVGSHFPPCER